MRRATIGDREILIFESEGERIDYFDEEHIQAGQELKDELAALLRAYQAASQKARERYGRKTSELHTQKEESLIRRSPDIEETLDV
jgi:hypothetical protein